MRMLGWKVYKKYGKFSKLNIVLKSIKLGYINISLAKDKELREFYISPNNTVWASTYYKGPSTDITVKAFIRKKILGHNYDVNKKKFILNAIDAAFYSSEDYFINKYKESYHGLI